jgi:hypothetical protein
MNPELLLQRCQAALQRAYDAGRDPGGMPVHTHNGAERLEPEWVREAPQQLIAAVMMDNRFADNRAEAGHSVGEPLGNLPSVQRQVGGSSPLGHQSSVL